MRRARRPKSPRRPFPWLHAIAGAVVAPVAEVAAWVLTRPSLPHALEAGRRTLETRAGTVSAYEDEGDGGGVPVLMLHSTGATGCAYELRGVFDALRGERPVVVVELPGYGFSRGRGGDGGDATAEGWAARGAVLVGELVRDVALRYGQRIDVVAVGDTGAVAARAIAASPRQVRSLVVVAPPRLAQQPLATALLRAASPVRRACAGALGIRSVGAAVHRIVTTRAALRAQLARSARHLPKGLVHHAHAAARQPDAYRAPVEAMRAALVAPPDGVVLPPVPVPTLVVVGADQIARGVLRSRLLENGRVVAVVPETRALPHVERPVECAAAMRAFWSGLRAKPELRLVHSAPASRPALRGALRYITPDRASRR